VRIDDLVLMIIDSTTTDPDDRILLTIDGGESSVSRPLSELVAMNSYDIKTTLHHVKTVRFIIKFWKSKENPVPFPEMYTDEDRVDLARSAQSVSWKTVTSRKSTLHLSVDEVWYYRMDNPGGSYSDLLYTPAESMYLRFLLARSSHRDGHHFSALSAAQKALSYGIFSLNLRTVSTSEVRTCLYCQRQSASRVWSIPVGLSGPTSVVPQLTPEFLFTQGQFTVAGVDLRLSLRFLF
jgi:hypothetical protein